MAQDTVMLSPGRNVPGVGAPNAQNDARSHGAPNTIRNIPHMTGYPLPPAEPVDVFWKMAAYTVQPPDALPVLVLAVWAFSRKDL